MGTEKQQPHVAANLEHIHDQSLSADIGQDLAERVKALGARAPPDLPQLTALELQVHVTVERAAEILGVHIQTFETVYGHLIRHVSPRCRRVKLFDLFAAVQQGQAA